MSAELSCVSIDALLSVRFLTGFCVDICHVDSVVS